MDRSDLRPDQHRVIDFIVNRPYGAVWLDMRQGKTISTLTAIHDLYETFETNRALVVAPLRVTINSWPEDLRGWDHLYLGYELLHGDVKTRRAKLASKAPIHIINRELLPWLVNEFEGKPWPYDTVVLDEARSYKNHSPKTPNGGLTRFGAIRKVRPEIMRLIQLTGTPAPRNYQDLWAQIFLLDGGKRLGKNITSFRRDYCVQGREHYDWRLQDDAPRRIERAVEDIVFRAKGVDIPELPPIDVIVRLPKAIKRQFSAIHQHGYLELSDGTEIVALDAAARVTKCCQISSGAVYDKDGDTHWLHDEKYRALDEVLETLDDNVLMVYSYQFEKDALIKKYPDLTVLDNDPDTVTRWNAGKIPKLLIHPASGGHGLNLARGGNTIIWVSPTYDNELYQQVNKRLSIPGKPVPTAVYRILADTPTERAIVQSLESKEQDQQRLLSHILKVSLGQVKKTS